MVLIVFNVVFWTLFEQAGSSLTLVRRPQHRLECVRPVHDLGAADAEFQPDLHRPLRAGAERSLWTGLAKRGLEPSIPVKFAIALDGRRRGLPVPGVGLEVRRSRTSRSGCGGWRVSI